MTIQKLQDLHPKLTYKSYRSTKEENELVVVYTYLLEPDITFESTIRFPCPIGIDVSMIDTILFQTGMVEAISYWKAACPPELVVEAGSLTTEDVQFFKNLFLHGLGEFYYTNDIDFTTKDFFTIKSAEANEHMPVEIDVKPVDLVLVGGGKDSALLLSLLSKSQRRVKPLVVNPSVAALETIRTLGFENPLVVTRTLDPKLADLNTKGYLNGHTPFSALLSFIALAVAAMNGCENVIVANEQSANEGNVVYRGIEVNHQYSKSLQYENLFRAHVNVSMTSSVTYFSAMRGYNDLQIAKMFAKTSLLLPVFRSCNRLRRTNQWCGACAKCAFTYTTLFPFVPYDQMMGIFGEDYFSKPQILVFLRELVGITPVKPFECVGTRDETKLAILLSIASYKKADREIPEGLLRLKIDAGLSDKDMGDLSFRVLDHVDDNHNVPDEHAALLMSAWKAA